jgi:hypothetical protein
MAGSQITAVNVGGDAASVGHGTIAVPQWACAKAALIAAFIG